MVHVSMAVKGSEYLIFNRSWGRHWRDARKEFELIKSLFSNLRLLKEKAWIFEIRSVVSAYQKSDFQRALYLISKSSFEGRNDIVVQLIGAACKHNLELYEDANVLYVNAKRDLKNTEHFNLPTILYLVNFCNRGLGINEKVDVKIGEVDKTVKYLFK